jgi:predicted transposase/invertase (TIGR01784 family)
MVNRNKTDFDSPWKEIIESFFPQFMEFFVPGSENDIDWNKEIKFLNTEFQKITKDSEIGHRHIDKLIEVTLKDNAKKWILIHVEVQAGREADFSERMFVYNYRIYDRYRIPVTSIAVLADDSPSWNPEAFKYGMWGSVMGLDYLKVKLLDYKKRWNYLKEDKNPFAIVVMAHLKALETKRNNTLKKQWKTELTKLLYERAYSKDQVLSLYSFIDWLLILPEELEKIFLEDLQVYEKEREMPYITSAERLGRQEGRREGRKEGSYITYSNLIQNLKNKNFSDFEICELTNLDIDTVKKIINNETVDIPLHLLDKETH